MAKVRQWGLPALVLIAVPVVVLASVGVSREIQRVLVTNFPDVFRVEGEVRVRGPIKQTQAEAFRDVLVPPVARVDSTRLVHAGYLETDGFAWVVVSLAGQLKGEALRPGELGVVLVPDEDVAHRALDEQGLLVFPLELASPPVSGRPSYFAAAPARLAVGFPRYRVLLYNNTDKSASVNIYAYLTP